MNKTETFASKWLKAGVLSCICLCSNALAADLLVPSQFSTIQAAVDAAVDGDTIRIAAGDYYEQVVLAYKNNISLVGEPGVTIHALEYPRMKETLFSYGWYWYPVLTLYRTQGVVLSGLAIDGEHLALPYAWNDDGTRQTRLLGIYFLGSGGEVTNCVVRNFRALDPTLGTDANGMHVFNRESLGLPVRVRVVDSLFENNQQPLLLRGDPANKPELLRTTISIERNRIIGLGPSPFWHVGIWLVCGVGGDVIGNTISGFSGTAGASSYGIAAYDAAAYTTHGRFVPLFPLNLEGNVLSNNNYHLSIIGGNDSRVTKNVFHGKEGGAFALSGVFLSGTNAVVADNDFADIATGILLVGTESWPSPWPPLPPAAYLRVTDNWFCNVPEPLRFNPQIVIGVHEQGTRTCENGLLNPMLQSITAPGTNGVALTLRGWHGDTVVIETSGSLVDWLPVYTNRMDLPLLEYSDPDANGKPQCFYRATRQ